MPARLTLNTAKNKHTSSVHNYCMSLFMEDQRTCTLHLNLTVNLLLIYSSELVQNVLKQMNVHFIRLIISLYESTVKVKFNLSMLWQCCISTKYIVSTYDSTHLGQLCVTVGRYNNAESNK